VLLLYGAHRLRGAQKSIVPFACAVIIPYSRLLCEAENDVKILYIADFPPNLIPPGAFIHVVE